MARKTISARDVVITTLGILVVVIVGYAALFGAQTVIVLKLRSILPHDQSLYSISEQLRSTEYSDGPGSTLSYFGYQFEAPWLGVEKEYRGSSLAIAYFDSGQVIMFHNPTQTIQMLNETRKVTEALGNTALRSNYSVFDYVLRVTPRQLSVFMPRQEAVRVGALLLLKLRLAMNSESGLYSFAWTNIKGFQCGSPGRTKSVFVNAFDRNDTPIQLIFSTNDGSQAVLSQSDINRVIRTLHALSGVNN